MNFKRTPRPGEATPGGAFLSGGGGGGGGSAHGGGGAGFIGLSMYKEPPCGDISLEEFERFALDRLRVLKAIEEARLRGKPADAVEADARHLAAKHLRTGAGGATLSRLEAARKDVLSHFILRLAYCRTADLRAWLLAHEAALFRARFRDLAPEEQVEFFNAVGLPYAAIGDAEFDALRDDLATVAQATGDVDGRAAIKSGAQRLFYKVPFAAVPDLVAARKVLLRGGAAYVARDQLHSLVAGSFRSHLSGALAELARRWGAFAAAEGGRLAPLVESMPSRSVTAGDGRKLPVGELTAGQVPALAAGRHFPLCMTVMTERLAGEHHLKHYGLQQLALFLKAIGLPLEQALLFWREQFAPRTPGDKFARQYAYDIRYNYGQEGKRTDWSEWSCVRIIGHEASGGAACAGVGECNGGCPFKTMNEPALRAALGRLRCSERYANEAVDKARGKHYQLACALAFEGVTGGAHETGINKPSDYYGASVELSKEREQRRAAAAGGVGGAEGVAATPARGGLGGGGAAGAGAAATPAAAAAAGGRPSAAAFATPAPPLALVQQQG